MSGLPHDKIVRQTWYPTELTSKWGQAGIYHHIPGCTPYGMGIVYYHIVIEIIDTMKHIKILLVIPLFFVCSMRTFAINRDSVMTVILDLLEKKHCYEVSLNPNGTKYSSESKPVKDVFLIDKKKV